MARGTSTNFTGAHQFTVATATSDGFVATDVQQLAAAVDGHNHTAGNGAAIATGLTLPLSQDLTFSPDGQWNIGTSAGSRPNNVYLMNQITWGNAPNQTYINGSGGALELSSAGTNEILLDSPTHIFGNLVVDDLLTVGTGIQFFVDNAYDIGASGANRPRNVYVALQVISAGNIQAPLAILGTNANASGEGLTILSGGATNPRLRAWGPDLLLDGSGAGIRFAGALFAQSDNTYDIGSSGSNRPRNMYLSGTAFLGGNLAIGGGPTYYGDGFIQPGANTLDIRVGTVPQTLRVYNTYTDANNYERLSLQWTSNFAFLTAEAAGTGSARAFEIGTNTLAGLFFRTNGTERWYATAAGHFLAYVDNTYDIGASGANRPRNVYVANNVVAPAIVSSGATLGLGAGGGFEWSIQAAGHLFANTDNTYDIGASGSSRPRNVYVAGTLYVPTAQVSGAVWPTSGAGIELAYYGGSGYLQVYDRSGSAYKDLTIQANNLTLASAVGGVGSMVFAPAANFIEQRNSTSPQTLRIYNTYTDANNYERLTLGWSGNAAQLVQESAGTGLGRALRIISPTTYLMDAANHGWVINGGPLAALTDNAFDIGASGGSRPRSIYAATSINSPDMPRANLLTNGGFEIWQRGTSFAAAGPGNAFQVDRWQIQGSGTGTLTLSKDTANVDVGSGACCAATYAHVSGTVLNVQQPLPAADYPQFKGRAVSFSVRVKTSVANMVRAAIYDGSAWQYSAYHSGNGAYATLSVSNITLSAAAASWLVGVWWDNAISGTAYLDNAMLVVGSQPCDYVPMHPADDLARCKRYYQRWAGASNHIAPGGNAAASQAYALLPLAAQFAVVPSLTVSAPSDFQITNFAGTAACTAMSLYSIHQSAASISCGSAGLTPYQAIALQTANANAVLALEGNP